jgi:hypothetical protein
LAWGFAILLAASITASRIAKGAAEAGETGVEVVTVVVTAVGALVGIGN